MNITKNTVVGLEYKLFDAQGNLIEEGHEPMVYLHGGYEGTLPKIEEALEGQSVGFEATVQMEPEDGFGEYDAELVKVEARDKFPEPLEVGMQFEGVPDSEDPAEDAIIFTVTDVAEDKVVLDGNHPLAGMALRFNLKVVEVRAATDEEIAHEHVHGAYGHAHDDFEEDESGDHYRSHPLH